MTEAEWLETLDPQIVFTNLQGKPSWRKLRLLATGCCRSLGGSLSDERSRFAVETAEQYADKHISSAQAMEGEELAMAVVDSERPIGQDPRNDAAAAAAVCLALWAPANWGTFQVLRRTTQILGPKMQMRLINCVFHMPQKKLKLDLAWLTETAVAIARGIYEERAFDRMPILADALQDAGCEDDAILRHCRGDGPHVRGCWVVDLVLGKE